MYKKFLKVKQMYGLLYFIILKNIINDILGIAILLSPHMKIKYIPENKIPKKLLNPGIIGNKMCQTSPK